MPVEPWRIGGRPGADLTPIGRKEQSYHHLSFPVGLLGGVLVLAIVLAGVAFTTVFGWSSFTGWHLSTAQQWVLTAAGPGLVMLGLTATRALAYLDGRLMCTYLGPVQPSGLQARLDRVTADRAALVQHELDARRRLERDLHDALQQRLTALALNLGLLRSTSRDWPEPSRERLIDAHEQSKEAVAELRSLLRGLHPAVLDDRGLDAAVSALAARCHPPATVTIDLPHRLAPALESTAYFIVSEALTNVARHARAEHVRVGLHGSGDTLVIEVADDGVGGADPRDRSRGTGLHGLATRTAALDGRLQLSSDPGQGTTLRVELPIPEKLITAERDEPAALP